jgi:hypothetical protein
MVGSCICKPNGEPGANWTLPGDKRRAAGGAALLPVIVGEERTLLGQAVDIGRPVSHRAVVVGAEVPVTDVVTEDHEDVWLLGLRGCGSSSKCQQQP